MTGFYQTTFTVADSSGIGVVALLKEITESIRQDLLASGQGETADSPPLDIESGETNSEAYARISAERDHPRRQGLTLRLDVRLCTDGDDGLVIAELVSRFLVDDAESMPDLPAGPPRLLQSLVEKYDCRVGTHRIGYSPVEVTLQNLDPFVETFVFSPERRLPILLVSEGRRGRPDVDPESAQRSLAGVAVVGLVKRATADELSYRVGTKLTAFNGAVRLIWPGSQFDVNGRGPAMFAMAEDARARDITLVRDVQAQCIDNAPASHFDNLFSTARATVILEKNRQLEAQAQAASVDAPVQTDGITASREEVEALRFDLKRERLTRGKEGRDLRKAQADLEVATQERDKALQALELLRGTVDGAEDAVGTIRGLQNDVKRLETDKREQADTIKNLKQRQERTGQESRSAGLRMKYPHPGNVTVLNYAINLFRDPMRHYIIKELDAADDRELWRVLRASVDFEHLNDQTTVRDYIDVNDFQNIVEQNQSNFSEAIELGRRLGDIRYVRNRAAHPRGGGLDKRTTWDGLEKIADALEIIGALSEKEEVINLLSLVG